MITNTLVLTIVACLYLVIGLGILLNQSVYKKIFESVLNNRALTFIIGLATFVVGGLIVAVHNIWTGSWEATLVTLIGWIMVIKSGLILLFPGFGSWSYDLVKFHKHMTFIGSLIALIGGVLLLLLIM